jgi:hypothetical protein
MNAIYEVGENYDSGVGCLHCETCGGDEIEPHEYHETADKCAVCHNCKCLFSFDPSDIEVDDQGDWHCPECKSPHVMIHEKCQCDIPTASGTVYQVHDEEY